MKYTVTAGCGHTVTVDLFGAGKERERRLAWMRSPSGKCNTCYAQGKRDEESHQHELEVQKYAALILSQIDRPGAIESLKSQVAELMRVGPMVASKDARIQAAIRVLAERES